MKFKNFLKESIVTSCFDIGSPDFDENEKDDIMGLPKWYSERIVDVPETDQERDFNSLKKVQAELNGEKNLLNIIDKDADLYIDQMKNWRNQIKTPEETEEQLDKILKMRRKGLLKKLDTWLMHQTNKNNQQYDDKIKKTIDDKSSSKVV